MRYSVSLALPFPPTVVWDVISDVRHFATDDPYHSEFRMLNDAGGVGTKFTMRHTYSPIFPFSPDHVYCLVTEWEPAYRQVVLERNPRAYRTHTQDFFLEPVDGGTVIHYSVTYRGVPWLLLPWKLWVDRLVRRRMREKLRWIEARCCSAR